MTDKPEALPCGSSVGMISDGLGLCGLPNKEGCKICVQVSKDIEDLSDILTDESLMKSNLTVKSTAARILKDINHTPTEELYKILRASILSSAIAAAVLGSRPYKE